MEWIRLQLSHGTTPLFEKMDHLDDLPIEKEDISRLLNLMHIQKLDVSIGCCSSVMILESSVISFSS